MCSSKFFIFIKALCFFNTCLQAVMLFFANPYYFVIHSIVIIFCHCRPAGFVKHFGAAAGIECYNRSAACEGFHINSRIIFFSCRVSKNICRRIYFCKLGLVLRSVNRNNVFRQQLIDIIVSAHQNHLVFFLIKPSCQFNKYIQALTPSPAERNPQNNIFIL